MSKLVWTKTKLPELGLIFLRTMLEKMRGDEGATVRLGTTGQGIRPNYQITLSGKAPRVFNGLNHEIYTGTERFDDGNLSSFFSFFDIRDAYEGTRSSP
ncbi:MULTISPECIES: hypothetical protein [Pseudomonas]|uniref:hypothetical protein n=1 Tax=Pseudomonas TaxID=286 RepID=UPI0013A790AB|nr:hypothetical protein [Pseudomonas sp. OIL-1]QIB51291.1 hypothetical protein G3M63_09670 [Pseudomonas sp. OIL-1]